MKYGLPSHATAAFYLAICAVTLASPPEARAAEGDHQDWPMWRGDARRSATIDNELPERHQLLWSRHLKPRKQAWDDPLNLDVMTYDRVFEPIVTEGLLCVGFNDQDKVVAYDVDTGEKRWTFFTEGPVRLPPAASNGRICFCSDDGYLYCVNALDGSLLWKFRGAPTEQHAVGNTRIISAWPARGGPVIYDNTVYFAASIWPFMGTFIYALDASDGSVTWINDETGAQYIKQPHSAPSFAGVAPQGAMVATEDYLIVPGGRSVPAVFDRHTGKLKYFEINAGGKGTGGSFVTADDLHYYVHTREKGTRAFNLATGLKTAFTPNEPVHAGGYLYSPETVNEAPVVRAYATGDSSNLQREPLWEVNAAADGDLILVGRTLLAASGRTLTLIRLPTAGRNAQPTVDPITTLTGLQESEAIARLLVADQKLIVVGDAGSVCVYGTPNNLTSASGSPMTTQATLPDAAKQDSTKVILDTGQAEGYAFWFGRADNEDLRLLAQNSPFVQLAVVDTDRSRIDEFRTWLDDRGLYGRITGHVGTPESFKAPQYVAHMVFAEVDSGTSAEALEAMYKPVRPYGGTLTLLHTAEDSTHLQRSLAGLNLERGRISDIKTEDSLRATSRSVIRVHRVGRLPGSADWTHQYGNIANTVKSDDKRVKLPLGILWFGGSSNMDVLPRHGHGPPEQVVGGRLIIQGMNCLSARDVYTGRILWKRDFDDLGTFDVYFDATYENTPLNPKYNQVHIPGANGRGTNYVVTDDRVYLLIGATCLMLDPATGEDLGRIELPENPDGSQSEWGYLGVDGDVLLGGFGFANFRERHGLEFASDKLLRASRAGFGSKSFDIAGSRGLIAYDRHSGKELWRLGASHSFWHNGIVAGNGKVYCLDRNPTPIEQAMLRRGLSLPDSYRIVCADIQTGELDWEIKEGIFGTWLGYSEKHNALLQAGAQGSDRLYSEAGQGMRLYDASTGKLRWKKDDLRYAGPCILHNELIITNANSYAESAGAFHIEDGRQHMVRHPLTGILTPWKMTRAYGCNNIIASENMLTFRSGAAGYYDLTTNSGTGNLGGFKSGCTSNLVVANGVLNAPDYTRTCSCSYQNQTSLALIHMPDMEIWSVNALANAGPKKRSSDADLASVDSVGFNLGAAGDRRAEDGTLWLEYPAKAGVSPPLEFKFNSDAVVYSQHSASRSGQADAWISSSGIDNLNSLEIGLQLTEKTDLTKGIRIAHAADDAEESESGGVGLTSSDLELTEDGGSQTVGLRFLGVPLPQGSADHITHAYLQFTCDEASDGPTSLWIAGELAPDAQRFTSDSHDVTSRTMTSSQIPWSPAPWRKPGESAEPQRTPDIAPILREIVSQPDWKSGQAIAFIVGGQGKRVAVSGTGTNKDSVRLVVESTLDSDSLADEGAKTDYDLQLTFAAPRGSDEVRVFDVYAQDQLIAQDVTVQPSTDNVVAPSISVDARRVKIAGKLRLKFVPRKGQALLSGLRLKKTDSQ